MQYDSLLPTLRPIKLFNVLLLNPGVIRSGQGGDHKINNGDDVSVHSTADGANSRPFFFFFFFFFFFWGGGGGGGGGIMQTVKTQFRSRKTRRLNWVDTVCLQGVVGWCEGAG